MNKALRTLSLALTLHLVLGTLSPALANASEVVVITHPSVGVKALSRDDVMRIFLGKSKTYPNGKQAVPVIPKEGAETRRKFETSVFQKTPVQIKAYWTRLLFTGRGNPPQSLESDEAIRQKVAENPNAIGYIDAGALDKSVRAVYTVE